MKPIRALVLPLVALLTSACVRPSSLAPTCAAVLGQPAPELALHWVDGEEGSLLDLRGRVVLLEFWRSWSEPCLSEVGHLSDLHERYADDGLAIVAVSTEDPEALLAAMASTGIDYPVATTPEGGAEVAYGVTAVPRAFLIDREGTLAWVGHPGTLEEGRLREVLFEH